MSCLHSRNSSARLHCTTPYCSVSPRNSDTCSSLSYPSPPGNELRASDERNNSPSFSLQRCATPSCTTVDSVIQQQYQVSNVIVVCIEYNIRALLDTSTTGICFVFPHARFCFMYRSCKSYIHIQYSTTFVLSTFLRCRFLVL